MNKSVLSSVINNGMVIQRDAAFPIISGKKMSVEFMGKIYESKETGGKWLVMLDPANAGGPFNMEIKFEHEEETMRLKDIYIGDVWLCSGQSNMEMQMDQLHSVYASQWDSLQEKPFNIRHFKVPRQWDFSGSHDEVQGGSWQCASKETLGEFSGVAWFFGRFMHEKYSIPIGLINSTWGGTPVEAWMSADALADFPEKIICGRQYIDPIKQNENTGNEEFFIERQPMGVYNAMLAPVLKFPLKGVIWYQGESNDNNPNDYAQLFKLMIQDWRKKNNNENLPFLFVQLPIWKEPSKNDEKSSWALIRKAQSSALSLTATGMAAALDLGQGDDLHPVNKKDVGYRLFLAADKTVFGSVNSSAGPMLVKNVLKNNEITLYFDNCANGLTVCSCTDCKDAFVSVICDEGHVRLSAKITGNDSISIDLGGIKNPQKILYAWADNPIDRQLFNSDGLPVIPFILEIKDKNV